MLSSKSFGRLRCVNLKMLEISEKGCRIACWQAEGFPKKMCVFMNWDFANRRLIWISIDTVRHVHLRTLSSTKGTKMNCASIGKYRENAWKCRSELKAFYILLFCSIMFYSIHIDSYSLIAELYPFRMERLIIPSRPWMCRLSESQSGNHPM